MNLHVFTDDRKIIDIFSAIQKSRNFNIEFQSVSEYKSAIKSMKECQVIYIDIGGFSDDSEIKKNLNYISKFKQIRCGIIDARNRLSGVAHYFHEGFCDYVNSNDMQQPLSIQRINEVLECSTCSFSDEIEAEKETNTAVLPAVSWDEIQEGMEYDFLLAYIRLDRQKKLKTEFGYDFIEKMTEKFEKYLEHFAAVNNGKLWNWDVNSGMLLFPYSRTTASAVITSLYRFIRDTLLLSNEILNAPARLEFTVIIDRGAMEYHNRGMTGTTISESLNRIYHAADLMAEAGNLYLFDSLFDDIPVQISFLFKENPDFEGHGLKRLKRMTY